MFDNLINQNRLSTAEKAEKADYYKTVLENERTSREQADKDIIGLLHDVKNRYDCKLSTYMAKKQQQSGDNKKPNNQEGHNKKEGKKQNKPQDKSLDDDWGASTLQQQDSNQSDDWGNATTTNNDDWGNNDTSNNDQNQTDDWGNDAGQSNDQANDDWDAKGGDTTKKDCRANGEDKNQDDDWGNTTTTNAAKNASDQKSNQKDQQGSNKKNINKQQPQRNSGSKQAKNQEKGQNQNDASCGTSGGANSSNNNKQDSKQATKTPSPATPSVETTTITTITSSSSNNNNNNQTPDKTTTTQNKDFLDMKSQLWTAKLDLRLLERDKSKLLDEVSSLRAERDELIQKMAQTNQEQDSMKVKVRGLTVDLLAANEEIHKLNDCIDQLETERRNRERDVNMSETKRRSMEGKYRTYQQQIADLQSELSLVKEEKEVFEKSSSDLAKRIERLENDLSHSKSLIRTLKDGCALVENQARTFEIRHDTVIMSKADLERELIAIKEESSRHITTINQLQKSNEKISKAFIQSVEAHEACKVEIEKLHGEFSRKLQVYEVENLRLVEANKQLRKVIDHLQKKR